jgi:hypothetical protein
VVPPVIKIDYTSIWTIGWFVWILYFAVLEGVALFRSKPGDTLSEHVWVWFGTQKADLSRPVTGWTRIRRVILGGFMLWLSIHFLTGGIWA